MALTRQLTRARRRHARGGVYIVVLMVAMLVAAMGVTGAVLARTERAGVEAEVHIARAGDAARAGLELAAESFLSDPAWRTSVATVQAELGTESAPLLSQELENAEISVRVSDPLDGDLADSSLDVVRVEVEARTRLARRVLRAELEPVVQPLNCFGAAVVSGGAMTFSASQVWSDGIIHSNAGITSVTSAIIGQARASSLATGSGYTRTPQSNAPTLTLPAESAIAVWQSRGTVIPISSIPSRQLRRVVLSAGSNPYGATNSLGIYVIDCANQSIMIEEVRIVGTLVLINPHSSSRIRGSTLMQPHQAGQPVLLVQGSFGLALNEADLQEAAAATNLNPAGTPYRGGTDSDLIDAYPSKIDGLVYVSGDLVVAGSTLIHGPLIAGRTLSMTSGELIVADDDAFRTSAPEGFVAVTAYRLSEGSLAGE